MALTPSSEPVIVTGAVQAVLVALVSLGWVTISSTAIDSVVTAVGAVLAIAATFIARSKVTPVGGSVQPAADPAK